MDANSEKHVCACETYTSLYMPLPLFFDVFISSVNSRNFINSIFLKTDFFENIDIVLTIIFYNSGTPKNYKVRIDRNILTLSIITFRNYFIISFTRISTRSITYGIPIIY